MSPPDRFDLRGSPFDFDDDQMARVTKAVQLIVAGIGVLILLFFVISMFYRIDASDEGVVLRFGAVKEAKVQPGLHWKLPWPIDTVYEVPVQRIKTMEFGFETVTPGRVSVFSKQSPGDLEVAEMLTGDLNLGHVEWIVQYRVKDPVQFLFEIGGSEGASWLSKDGDEVNPSVPDTIQDISESVMRKLVGDSSIDYVLTIGRDQIAKEAEELIQEELDSFQAGVDIVTVKLQTTAPPTEAVQDAFQEVNRARQKKEKVVNEAQGERNSKIPAARGAKDKAIAESEGYKNRVILTTNGKINAFLAQLAEYEKAPDITRKRLYLETMEAVLARVGSKTIIDDSVRGVLPLLNLDQGRVAKGVQP